MGCEDHPTGIADADGRYATLEAWARKYSPINEVDYRWSGQVLEPHDSLAFIGRNPHDKQRNIFIATGDSGNGITHGTIAGMILSDLIAGKKNRWAKLYNPSRKMPKEKRQEDPGGSKAKKEQELGQGLIVEGKKPVAYYRDENDLLHSLSAVCTHLGCTVQWNGPEKSFDCPCHGSRFSYAGKVVTGPANDDAKADRGRKHDSITLFYAV